MTVPLIDLRRRVSVLEADVLTAWTALLKEGPLIGGPAVEQFESNLRTLLRRLSLCLGRERNRCA